MSYKVDPTAPEKEDVKTTDTNRLKKANFAYDDDGEMLQMISR